MIEKNEDYNLSSFAEIYETGEDLAIDDIICKTGFIKNQADFIYRGFSKNHFWLKFSVQSLHADQNRYVVLTSNQLDVVDFYYQDEKGEYKKLMAGDHRPFSEWSEKWSSPTFNFSLEENRSVS